MENSSAKSFSPVPYDLDPRKELVIKVISTLGSLSDERTPRLLIFWGSSGIGKTRLLRLIQEQVIKYRTDILVEDQIDISAESYLAVIEKLQPLVKNNPQEKKRILLLDNIDFLLHNKDLEAFYEFERTILCPLVSRRNTLIVMTSHSRIDEWAISTVRDQRIEYPIQILNQEEVVRVTDGWKIDLYRAYSLSKGHPKALLKLKEKPDITDAEFYESMAEYFLENLPEELHELALIISQLPLFNVDLLRKILPETGETFLDTYYKKIRDLGKERLLSWDMTAGMYRFQDGIVRQFLAQSMKFKRPQLYRSIQEKALLFFEDAARYSFFLKKNIVSIVYHKMQVELLENNSNSSENIKEWFENEKSETWKSIDWSQVLPVWQNGFNDPILVKELRNLMGEELYEWITLSIGQAIGNEEKTQ